MVSLPSCDTDGLKLSVTGVADEVASPSAIPLHHVYMFYVTSSITQIYGKLHMNMYGKFMRQYPLKLGCWSVASIAGLC